MCAGSVYGIFRFSSSARENGSPSAAIFGDDEVEGIRQASVVGNDASTLIDLVERFGWKFIRASKDIHRTIQSQDSHHADLVCRVGDFHTGNLLPSRQCVECQARKTCADFFQSRSLLFRRIHRLKPNIGDLGGTVESVRDDRKSADDDDPMVIRQRGDEPSCGGAHVATVSLTRQAISQNSATDDGSRIQGSLLSVIFDGGAGGRLRRSRSILKRNAHSS